MAKITRLTAGPPDAKINSDGFRTYRWEDRELLSVTSIRKLLGAPFPLVNWQIGKVVDRALTREFWRRFHEITPLTPEEPTGDPPWASESDLLRLRKWLKEATTEDRDRAATKGLDIHGAIELGLEPDACNEETRPYVIQVRHLLAETGWTVVAQEFQVFNLAVGYAGTADVLFETPEGEFVLGDWKSSKGVYPDHVAQLHAYMGGEFVGLHGKVNEDLTAKLASVKRAIVVHLAPDSWKLYEVPYTPETLTAFFGSVYFAKWLAANPKIDSLASVLKEGRA